MPVSTVVMVTSVILSGVLCQVNREIDQFEDLLAVDSFDNEVQLNRVNINSFLLSCRFLSPSQASEK